MVRFRLSRGLSACCAAVTICFTSLIVSQAQATSPVQSEPAPAFQVREPDPEATARTLGWLRSRPASETPKKVWVYFTDKDIFDSETCLDRLATVRATVPGPARERRANVLGEDLVDFLDIPVHRDYVAAVSATGAEIVHQSRWLNAVSVRAHPDILERIATLPFVQKLEPVRGSRKSYPEPDLSRSPGGSNPGPQTRFDYGQSFDQLDEIGVIDAHDLGYDAEGVIVCMLDTGYRKEHDVFAEIISSGRLLAEWDFINNDGNTQNELGDPENQDFHGTATWSALGGFFEGELIGPAYGASFLIGKTEDTESETPVEEDNWVAGAEWADENGAHVISSSLGYKDWYTWEDLDGDTGITTIATDIAASRGIVVCTSAGNEGTNDWYYVLVPADADSVISVGATDWFNELAGFSSHGPTWDGRTKPEVLARGVDTYCAILPEWGSNYSWVSGTSLSCPLVGGCAALLIGAHPNWGPMRIREALMMTADNADTPDNDRGWGRINVTDAIGYAPNDVADASIGPGPPVLHAAPNPFGSSTTLRYRLPRDAGPAAVDVYDIGGRHVRSLTIHAGDTAFTWDGRDASGARVAPGVYLVDLRAGEWRITTKLVMQ